MTSSVWSFVIFRTAVTFTILAEVTDYNDQLSEVDEQTTRNLAV